MTRHVGVGFLSRGAKYRIPVIHAEQEGPGISYVGWKNMPIHYY